MKELRAISITGSELVIDGASVTKLESRLRGQLLTPEVIGYDDSRRLWNGLIDKRPALIVRCAGVTDVMNSVNFARDNNLLVAVRGGGHSIPGNSVCDGGLMVDLSLMRGVHVDPNERIARAEGGALTGDLDHETESFGLATTSGGVSSIGIGGLTLGGGEGRIGRVYGLAIDNLLSVDIVTADGRFLRADAHENSDLFWGVRGGGGNFGIATSFQYQLHPFDPVVVAGNMIYPIDKAREGFKIYHQFAQEAPDKLCIMGGIGKRSDGDFFTLSICYIGTLEEAEQALSPLRELGIPISSTLERTKLTDIKKSAALARPQGIRFYWKSNFVNDINQDVIDTLMEYFPLAPFPDCLVTFFPLGGAVSRVGKEETAFFHRDALYDYGIGSVWTDLSESRERMDWVDKIWTGMRPYTTSGVYVNNLGDEGEDRVRLAYGDNYDKLVTIKDKYDPSNLFRLNQNIKPKS